MASLATVDDDTVASSAPTAPLPAAEEPLWDEAAALASAPAATKDKLVRRLKERLTVLDACAAVDLTDDQKEAERAKKPAKKKASKKKGGDDGDAARGEAAAQALRAKHDEDYDRLTRRLDEERAAFEADLAGMRAAQADADTKADADCSSRVAALRAESDRLRKLYCPA